MARDQHREARMEQMQKWLSEFQLKLPEYDDVFVRHTVGRVIAVDAETIRVRIRDTDVEIGAVDKPYPIFKLRDKIEEKTGWEGYADTDRR